MNSNRLVGMAGVLAIAVAGAALYFQFRGQRIDLGPYTASGEVAGEETSKAISGTGSVVVVIEDPGEETDPVSVSRLSAFTKGLRRSGNARIEAVEKILLDSMSRFASGGAVPPDQYVALRQKYAKSSALVFFLPVLIKPLPDGGGVGGKSSPVTVVVAPCLPGYRELIRSGAIQIAIMPKNRSADDVLRPAKSPRELFQQEFILATPATPDLAPF